MKKLILFAELVIACLLFALIYSCTKEHDLAISPVSNTVTDMRTTITGLVFDENDQPLAGVTVMAYGASAATGGDGTFLLKDVAVNKKRCLVRFAKPGFMDRVHGFVPGARGVNYMHIVLTKKTFSHTLSSSTGGTVALADNASIVFQPNSFVTAADGKPYSGSVSLAANHLTPTSENFGFMIPGGDLLGIDANGREVVLYSFGMLEVELTGTGGAALQLAPGAKATISMPISLKQINKAPPTIPLWSFDKTTAMWKEEGQATRIGSDYVGEVSHFSKWNCDYSGPKSFVQGKVLDCENAGIPNVVVTIDGWWHTETDQNGYYQNWVPSGISYTIQVLVAFNPGLAANSQLEIIPALSPGQVFTVPHLIVACHTRVTGFLVTCDGQGSPGMVLVTAPGNYTSLFYSMDGHFKMPVVTNTHCTLKANNGKNMTILSFTSALQQGAVQDLGAIALCDSLIVTGGNYFTLTAGPFSNKQFDMAVSSFSAGVNAITGVPKAFFNMSGKASGYDITLQAILNDSLAGPTQCTLAGTMTDGTTTYTIQSAYLSCQLTNTIGPPGSPVKGTYTGNINLSENGHAPVQGYISGSFDVIRTE